MEEGVGEDRRLPDWEDEDGKAVLTSLLCEVCEGERKTGRVGLFLG